MADALTPVKILVGLNGTVEIQGISDIQEAEKVARKLGLERFEKLIRAETVSEDVINHVRGRARILGYELQVGAPAAEAGTPAPVRVREEKHLPWKAVLGFGGIIAVLLALAVTLTGIGIGIRDRIQHEYTPVHTLSGALALAQNAAPEESGVQGLLNPDDTRYLSLSAGNWILFGNGEAVLDGHYVQIQGLKQPLADLLKAEGSLTFHIDTRQSSRNTLFIEEVLSGGNPVGSGSVSLRAWPLAVGAAPAGYPSGEGVLYDDKATFENLDKVSVTGRLQKTERGLRVNTGTFSIAVGSDLAPGLDRILNHFVQAVDSEGNPVDETVPSPLIFNMEMQEIYPWATNGEPERRQLYREIGSARLDGVVLAGQYFPNL